MLSLNSDLTHLVSNWASTFKTSFAAVSRFGQLLNRAVETDPLLAAVVVIAALLIATIGDWYLQGRPNQPKKIRRKERQQYALKGRSGQTIGSVKMNEHQNLEGFVEDLTALNQIVRGGRPGPSARLEVTELKCLRSDAKENRTQYSTFTGSLCIGMGCVPVQGLAKIRCRKDMIFPEVEFESELGKFRIDLPEIPKVLGSRSLKFNVDIGIG